MNLPPVSDEDITLGCIGQGVFYPLSAGYKVGYWYRDRFNDIEEGDFSQVRGATPVYFSQDSATFSPLSEGYVPGFLCKGLFYRTKESIPGYMEGLTIRLNQSERLDHPRVSGVISRSAVGRLSVETEIGRGQFGRNKCAICMAHPAEYQKLKVNYCLSCLKERYLKGDLFSGEGEGKVYWTPQIIAEVHTVLYSRLPPEEKLRFPQSIKTPSDCVICIGRTETLIQGYPPKGHFVGYTSLCVEAGCPNPDHHLCKKCANLLENCPECGEFIWYEEPPSKCPRCETVFCYEFDNPCIKCKEQPIRRKPALFSARKPTFPKAYS